MLRPYSIVKPAHRKRLTRLAERVSAAVLSSFGLHALAQPACLAPPGIPLRIGTSFAAADAARRGAWYSAQKLYTCSADSFELAARLDPTNPEMHLAAAAALDAAGRRVEAEQAYELALSSAARAAEPELGTTALDRLSADLLVDKDYLGVISLLGSQHKSTPLSVPQTLNLGEALALLTRLDEAIMILNEGLQRFPTSEQLADQKATVQILAVQHDQAYATLEAALKQHAHDPAGEHATEVLYLRALISGNSDKARSWADQMVNKYPEDAEVLYLAADLAWKTGNGAGAQELVKRSLTHDAGNPKAQQLCGTLLAQAGELTSARQHLERAIELGDSQPDVRYQLARVQTRLGDTEAARHTLEAYKHSKAADQARIDTAEDVEHGEQALRDGNPSAAASSFRKALALSPDEALIHYQLSQAMDRIHDLVGESDELERTLSLNPNFVEALNQSGFISLHQGETAKAETYFLKATRISPAYVIAWNNLAAAYASEARWKDATEAADRALRLDPANVMANKLKASIAASQATP